METGQWRLTFRVPAVAVPVFETFLDDAAGAIVVDGPDAAGQVPVTAYVDDDVEEARIAALLGAAAELCNIETPAFTLEPLPEADWVAESEKGLPAIRAGRVYLYGKHIRARPPAGSIALRVEAGLAFGTGRHETTYGCLIVMQTLHKRGVVVRRALDMGCGSGVLAMAAARLWKAPVLAVDNDPVSVAVTQENAQENGVAAYVMPLLSEGYADPHVAGGGSYDLILANILAEPLVAMARHVRRNLAPGGHAVLSGILDSQQARVVAAHRAQGLVLVRRFLKANWATLLMRRPVGSP